LLGLQTTFSERGANSAQDAIFFSEEKFERRDCPETGLKRRMCGHICAAELRRVSHCVSEKWTERDSCARAELKKLSASGSALAIGMYSGAAHRGYRNSVFLRRARGSCVRGELRKFSNCGSELSTEINARRNNAPRWLQTHRNLHFPEKQKAAPGSLERLFCARLALLARGELRPRQLTGGGANPSR
jgi:hypothetical protein